MPMGTEAPPLDCPVKARSRPQRWLATALVASVLWSGAPALGETPPEGGTDLPAATRNFVDTSHETVSTAVESLARTLDSFFTSERVYEESTGSFGQITGIATVNEGGSVDLKPKVRLNLTLPRTQERLHFYLESHPDEPEKEELQSANAKALEQSEEKRGVFTGLLLTLRRTGKWNVNAGGGIRLKIPPDPFLRARARYSVALSEWTLRATETLFWFGSLGLGETTRVDFDRPFLERFLFRSASEATYILKDENADLSESLYLFHRLTERQALVWQTAVLGETNPTWRRTGYLANVRYRTRLYRTWVLFEIKPQVRWDREDGYRPTSSLTFQLDYLFGDEYR